MALFNITPHTISASHIREFPRGSTSAVTPPQLKFVVNQYVPRSHLDLPSPGDLTIIFCHGNGLPKVNPSPLSSEFKAKLKRLQELYEPFFDEVLLRYENSGLKIRSIWAPDAVHQGASGILNESFIGDEPSWNDFSRDLLHMVNMFSAEMQPPLVGIGHSYGAHAVARAALNHSSLFTSLVLLDPVLEEIGVVPPSAPGRHPAQATANRLDTWPSLAEAEKFIRSRPFNTFWDPRVLDLYIKHGFRSLPTITYPNKTGVTLTTPKHQEVYTFLRPSPEFKTKAQLGRAEPGITFRHLKYLAPPVLYIIGGKSAFSGPVLNKRKINNTRVAEVEIIEGYGHLIPLEAPVLTAELAVTYLIRQVKRWGKEAEKDLETIRSQHLSNDFLERLSKL